MSGRSRRCYRFAVNRMRYTSSYQMVSLLRINNNNSSIGVIEYCNNRKCIKIFQSFIFSIMDYPIICNVSAMTNT